MLPLMHDQIVGYERLFEKCVAEGWDKARAEYGTNPAKLAIEAEKAIADLMYLAMRRLCQNDLFCWCLSWPGRI